MSFMNYRLADVRISPEVTVAEPDIVWRRDGEKAIAYDGHRMTFTGDWPAGPIQKVIVTMLALRMEAAGLHPFHSSAVRYRGRTVMFLGGESNHGKSMGQIEACRRGAQLVSTETTVIDEDGVVQSWARSRVFLKKRTEGTERADKAGPEARRRRSSSATCRRWELFEDAGAGRRRRSCPPSTATSTRRRAEMIPFERQFQTLHSLQNYFLLNELLAPGPADADRRHRGAAAGAGRRSSSGSRTGRTTSSGPRRRRCCSTKSTGSSRRPMRRVRLRAAGDARRGGRAARRARRRRARLARRRHGPDHPAARRDDPAATSSSTSSGSRSSTPAIADVDGRVGHRRADGDDRHRGGRRRAARLPGARRGGARRRLGADPQPGDAGGQHLQRVAGRGHGAGAARLRRAWSSPWAPAGGGGSRSTSFFVRSGRHDARAAASWSTAIELPVPDGPRGLASTCGGRGGAATTWRR